MKTTPQRQHHTRVSRYATGPDKFIVRCDCGWHSSGYISESAAENAATDHVVAATPGEG